MIRWVTAGESHGSALLGILEGVPAGLGVSAADVDARLVRRQGGEGRGARMKIERDRVEIVSGLWKGKTTGAPIGMRIANRGEIPQEKHPRRTVPRPGHADLTGMLKHGFDDANPAIERASARETAMRVALGAVAHGLLRELGIGVFGHVVALGGVEARPDRSDWGALLARRDASPLYCADPDAEAAMLERIAEAREARETLGGVAEVVALGVPPGFGSYVQWDRRIEAALGRALLSIPSVKAAAVGDGVETPAEGGRSAQDEVFWERGVARRTNRAGGVEGGITNGSPVVARAFFKPISTQRRPLRSVDLSTGEETESKYVRSDVVVVPAGSVVAEAMVALVLAGAALEKLGGDHVGDTRSALDAYLARIPWRRPDLPAALLESPAAPAESAEAPAEET
ncbi:MAG TPA: chorismate synthase [Gemmatimonadota bacterium]|nr:chorismate synthase [Gemmatimonadota bacterium]